jgi:hypothetical protein
MATNEEERKKEETVLMQSFYYWSNYSKIKHFSCMGTRFLVVIQKLSKENLQSLKSFFQHCIICSNKK